MTTIVATLTYSASGANFSIKGLHMDINTMIKDYVGRETGPGMHYNVLAYEDILMIVFTSRMNLTRVGPTGATRSRRNYIEKAQYAVYKGNSKTNEQQGDYQPMQLQPDDEMHEKLAAIYKLTFADCP